jgi:hypothetical protein
MYFESLFAVLIELQMQMLMPRHPNSCAFAHVALMPLETGALSWVSDTISQPELYRFQQPASSASNHHHKHENADENHEHVEARSNCSGDFQRRSL